MFKLVFDGDPAKCASWVGFAKRKAVSLDRLLSMGLRHRINISDGGYIDFTKRGGIYVCRIVAGGAVVGYEFFCLWNIFQAQGEYVLVQLQSEPTPASPEAPVTFAYSANRPGAPAGAVFPVGAASSRMTKASTQPTAFTAFHRYAAAGDGATPHTQYTTSHLNTTRPQIPEQLVARDSIRQSIEAYVARYATHSACDPSVKEQIELYFYDRARLSQSESERVLAGSNKVGKPQPERLFSGPEGFDPKAQQIFVTAPSGKQHLVLVERELVGTSVRFYFPETGQLTSVAIPSWVLNDTEQSVFDLTQIYADAGITTPDALPSAPLVLWESNSTGTKICCAIGNRHRVIDEFISLGVDREPYASYHTMNQGYLEYTIGIETNLEGLLVMVPAIGRNAVDYRHVSKVGYPWSNPDELHVVKARYKYKYIFEWVELFFGRISVPFEDNRYIPMCMLLAVFNEVVPIDEFGAEGAALRSDLIFHGLAAATVYIRRSSGPDEFSKWKEMAWSPRINSTFNYTYYPEFNPAGSTGITRWDACPYDVSNGYLHDYAQDDMGYRSIVRTMVACDLRSGSIAYRRKDRRTLPYLSYTVPRDELWHQSIQMSIEYHKGLNGPMQVVAPQSHVSTMEPTLESLVGYAEFDDTHALWEDRIVKSEYRRGLHGVLQECYVLNGHPWMSLAASLQVLSGQGLFVDGDVVNTHFNDWGIINSSPQGDWALYIPRPYHAYGTLGGVYHPDADVIEFVSVDPDGNTVVHTTSHEAAVDHLWPDLWEHEDYVGFKLSAVGLLASSGVWGRIPPKPEEP